MINFVTVVLSGSRSDDIPSGYVPVSGPSGTFFVQALTDSISDTLIPFLTGATFSGAITASVLLGPGTTGQFTGSIDSAISASYADFATSASYADVALTASIAIDTELLLDTSPFVLFTGSQRLSSSSVLQSSDGTINVDASVPGEVNLSVTTPFFIPLFNGFTSLTDVDVTSSIFGGGYIDTTEFAGFVSGTFDVLINPLTSSLTGVFQLYDEAVTGSLAVLTASSDVTGTFQLFSTSVVVPTGSRAYSVFARVEDFGSGSLQISMSRVKLTS